MALKNREIYAKKSAENQRVMSWKKIAKKIFFWLSFFAFCGVTFWTLLLSNYLKIKTIDVESNWTDERQIIEAIREKISGKYFGYIPRDNLLVFPKAGIRQGLKDKFILIKELEIARIFPDTLSVKLNERQNKMVWCVSQGCFLVDENGQAFFKINLPEQSEYGQLVKVEDKSENQINIGQVIISSQAVSFFSSLPSVINSQLGIEVENTLTTPSAMSEEVKLSTKAGWQVYFNTLEPIDKQLSILQKLIEQNINQDNLNNLEYIDLRVKGKATYKMKPQPGEMEQSPDSENTDILDDNPAKSGNIPSRTPNG